MDNELFGGLVNEKEKRMHAEYTLNEAESFYDIGFRVMKNQQSGVLIPCHKLKYNGKVELVYFIENMTSLEDKLLVSDSENCGNYIKNLIDAINEIENNGFLNLACVENRLDRIYVDNSTNKIKLIYLPLNLYSTGNEKGKFESTIRSRLIKLLREMPSAEQPKIVRVIDNLMDGTLTFNDLGNRLKMEFNGNFSAPVSPVKDTVAESNSIFGMSLVSVDKRISFEINKNEFIIGKSKQKADGVIEDNIAVSRVHCKIVKTGRGYSIADLGSSNGTFVDGVRLTPEVLVELSSTSKIKIANENFVVRGI